MRFDIGRDYVDMNFLLKHKKVPSDPAQFLFARHAQNYERKLSYSVFVKVNKHVCFRILSMCALYLPPL